MQRGQNHSVQAQSVFLTEEELATRHRRSIKTLRNDRVAGRYIPFVKIGRNVRYKLDDVIAYEVANRRESTSEETAL